MFNLSRKLEDKARQSWIDAAKLYEPEAFEKIVEKSLLTRRNRAIFMRLCKKFHKINVS